MSQLLVPTNGGLENVSITSTLLVPTTLSPEFIIANSLQPRPTEWIPGGRPIYRRLPAVSETYQIDFFNVVYAPNSAVAAEVEKIGYIYVPFTENSAGPTSIVANASDTKKDLLICGGRIIWEYGGVNVAPVIINLQDLEVRSGKYFLGYELLFDDAPQQKTYAVEDFALTGLPLTITSSTDSVVGWRYPPVNSFLNVEDNFWTSKDTYFPSYAQPTESYLQWESELSQAYSSLTLRCAVDTVPTATASLYYVTTGGVELFQGTVGPSVDTTGVFYKFTFTPAFNTGWKVVWSNLDVAIQSIVVSGSLVLERKPVSPATRATLVMYPDLTPPPTAVYCPLAFVEVDNAYKITKIEDLRYVIRRDYVPVADWLTTFFDRTLIDLYEQVESYPKYWMNPPTCMKQEYLDLSAKSIVIV